MKRNWKLFAGVLLACSVVSVFAQKRQPAPDRQVVIERQIQITEGAHPAPPEDTFIFIASEMSFDGKLVKGIPYSGQAVTATTQTLSDGNRIVNKSTALLYRDSEGRTRREQTLRAIGPFATAGEPPQTILISDPVAGVTYALDPRSHVARKMPPMRLDVRIAPPPPPPPPDGAGPPLRLHGPPPPERAETQPDMFFRRMPPPPPGAPTGGIVMEWHGAREENAKRESLGNQTIEGIEAEGTRSTVTIPVGEIGNERAIEIVFERWYSPVLQTVVMSRHSDPRFGETVYRLTNISRDEPALSLFEVPADYRIKDGPPRPEPMRMRRPANNPL